MTMPAGKYFIGDLCYVMHDVWDEVCDRTISGYNLIDGEFNLKDGRRFATFCTKYGDGLYRDNYGNRYPVDAGLIGCIRVEDIKDEGFNESDPPGAIIEFESDFSAFSDRMTDRSKWDGTIQFGFITIQTDDDGEYDEEDSY